MGNHPTTTGTQEKQEKSINQNRSGGSNSKCGNTWLPNSKVSRSRVAAFLSDSQALYLYLYQFLYLYLYLPKGVAPKYQK